MKLTIKELLTWIGGIIVALGAAVTFLFSTFQTRADSKDYDEQHDKRLERIENKIDQLMERLIS